MVLVLRLYELAQHKHKIKKKFNNRNNGLTIAGNSFALFYFDIAPDHILNI